MPRPGHISPDKSTAARASLIGAYRQGLGLAAIAVIRVPEGVRVAVEHCAAGQTTAVESLHARYWFRRAADAERTAAAVLRRKPDKDCDAAGFACESIRSAAKRLNVLLFSDEQIDADAIILIDRIEREIEHLRNTGGMRPVNKSYQTYRLDAAARGERVVPYAQWMRQYSENLVREAAATLKYL